MNKTRSLSLKHIIPVLFSFFIMSFIDLVGTGVDELKSASGTPDIVLQLIPFVAFIWFFVLSIPVSVWQSKIGKKNMLSYGVALTAIGLFLPILGNSIIVILSAFSLLGIGNTILQVSANPLLVDITPNKQQASFLSLSQFVKALGSMVGPFVAGMLGPWIAELLGMGDMVDWRFGLYIFGVLSVLTFVWIRNVNIEEEAIENNNTTFGSSIALLKTPYILSLVFGIFILVGIDVAMNSNIATLLTAKINLDIETAKYTKSLYFLVKMIGSFVGAILLTKVSSRSVLLGSSVAVTVGTIGLLFIPNTTVALVMIGIIGFGAANIFPLLFSLAVDAYPEKANEISGLMMMAISGGAIYPFLVGFGLSISANIGAMVLIAGAFYLTIISMKAPQK